MLTSGKNQTSHLSPLHFVSTSQHTLSPFLTSKATSRPTTSHIGDRSSRQFERSIPYSFIQTERNQGLRDTLRLPKGIDYKKSNNGRNSEQINQSSIGIPSDREPLKTKDMDQKWLTQTLGGPKVLRAQIAFSKKPKNSIENKEPTVNKIIQKLTEKQKLLEELKKIAKIELPSRGKNNSKDIKNLSSVLETENVRQTVKNSIKEISVNNETSLKSCLGNPLRNSRKEDLLKVPNPEMKKTISNKTLFLTPKSNKKSDAQKSQTNFSNSRSFYSPDQIKKDKGSIILKKDSVIAAQLLSKSRKQFGKKPRLSDFKLLKKLGEGKFGTVFTALHIQTGWLYALKKISKSVIKSHMMVDQLITEIKIQSFCSHKNIVRLYDCFDDQQNLYLILEYMEDGTLFEFLKKNKTLSELQTAEKVKEVTQAVKYLHDHGIAHRDIKPQNIVIDNGVGKLCDFGWAAICNERRKTYCGTFDYAAPEILEGSQYDISVDLWCIGVLAFELIVGKAPFYHISRKQTMKKIMNVDSSQIEFPSSLSQNGVSFIQNLLKKQPQERMTADALLHHPFLSQVQRE